MHTRRQSIQFVACHGSMLWRGLKTLAFAAQATVLSARHAPGPTGGLDALLPVVAIVGQHNVGKSTLFNRLVRRRAALVYDTPEGHVTRDCKTGIGAIGDLRFNIIDTPGLEPFMAADSVQGRATTLACSTLSKADIALLLLDGRQGVTAHDVEVTRWLRRQDYSCSVVLALNKCDGNRDRAAQRVQDAVSEAVKLGLGDPVCISAETGEGMADLFEAMRPQIDTHGVGTFGQGNTEEGQAQEVVKAGTSRKEIDEGAIKVAIMGLPNVGKSTLVNLLMKDQVSLTGPEPGLTRDAVHASFVHEGRTIELVDAAGWIRKLRLQQFDESGGRVAEMACKQGDRELQQAQVVLLMLDASRAVEQGMLSRESDLARRIALEGRALVVAINKMDCLDMEQQDWIMNTFQHKVANCAHGIKNVPVVCLSAESGRNVDQLMPAILEAYGKWNKRVNTAQLNKWLQEVRLQQDLQASGFGSRLRYATQIKTRPPSFVVFVRGSNEMQVSQVQGLSTAMQREFGLEGVPLRLSFRYKTKWADSPRGRKRK